MDEIVIYGASDDLIEIESTSFPVEELNWYGPELDDGKLYLAVSDGTVLRVRYDEDGIWRFTPVVVGSASLTIWQCPATQDKEHSDRVTLTGDELRWVVLAEQIAR